VSLALDSFLIDQAKATMMQIVNLNMYKQMDHWYIYIYYELARDGRKGGRIGVTSWNWRCPGKSLKKVKTVVVNTIINGNNTNHCSGKSLTPKTESDGNLGYVLSLAQTYGCVKLVNMIQNPTIIS